MSTKPKKLIVFDVNHVLIDCHSTVELAKLAGRESEMKQIFAVQLEGYRGLDWAIPEAAKLLVGITVEKALSFAESIPYMLGARETIDKLRESGYLVVVISSGFSIVIQPICRELGIEASNIFCNELAVEGGKIVGLASSPVSTDLSKLEILNALRTKHKIDQALSVAVGDGFSDFSMLLAAGLGIAFRPTNGLLKILETTGIECIRIETLAEIPNRLLDNPYLAGTALQSEEVFYGREELLQEIVRIISHPSQGQPVVLYGSRRIGKTSVLNQLANRILAREPYIPILIDMYSLATRLTERALFAELASKIAGAAEKSGYLAPSVDWAIFEREPTLSFDRFLDDFLSLCPDQKVVLLFDEMELLQGMVKSEQSCQDIFRYLRSLLQHRTTLAFVFTVTRDPGIMKESYWGELFSVATAIKVGFLPEQSVRDLVNTPAKGRLRFLDEAIEEIIRIAACHPFFTQLLCFHAFELGVKTGCPKVDKKLIQEAEYKALESAGASFSHIWNQYPSQTQLLLSFLARCIYKSQGWVALSELQVEALNAGIQIDLQQWHRVLEALCHAEVLESKSTRKKKAYRFRIELMWLWVFRKRPSDELLADHTDVPRPRVATDYEGVFKQGASSDTGLTKYERGLDRFRSFLRKRSAQIPDEFLGLESRLRENLQSERINGSTEIVRHERTRITIELDKLSAEHLGCSFNELCST